MYIKRKDNNINRCFYVYVQHFRRILDDDQYVRVVERCIEQTIEQYAIPVYTKSFLLNPCSYMNIAFQIRDDLGMTLLMMIRGETVKFAEQKAKRIRESEKRLEEQIKNAHLQHCEQKTERSASSLQNFKNELENLRKPYIAVDNFTKSLN